MNVFLIGATGYVGSGLLRELLARGQRVSALVRDASKLPAHAALRVASADVYDPVSLAHAVRDHDAVVSAFSPGHDDPRLYEQHLAGARAIIAASQRAHVPRLLFVGGAGSLEVAPGVELVDTPDFPAQWKQTALATRAVLGLLRAEPELDWTFLSPAAHLLPGERSGRYRVGKDALFGDAAGESRISVADYAVALVDELERPAHRRARFSVAY